MKQSTILETTDTIKISIRTSADGLAGIPAQEYVDKVIDMVIDAFPMAFVELDIDERISVSTRVTVSALGEHELSSRDEISTEERVLEIVRHQAFDACCNTSDEEQLQ